MRSRLLTHQSLQHIAKGKHLIFLLFNLLSLLLQMLILLCQ